MRKLENVEYSKPFELLFLLASTIAMFSGIIFLSNRIMNFGLIKGLLAFVIAGSYFLIIKKKFIIKISDFELTSHELEWNNNSVDFKNIESYKIHWLKGAGIKFKLKNGKVIRISSNDNFCDSEKFINLCRQIDSKLLGFNNNQILRKKSFFETKQGYYFAIIMTIFVVIITIIKIFSENKLIIGNIALIFVVLGIISSAVMWKKE